MLNVALELIERINFEKIECCSWKNNNELLAALNGDGDVDLLVSCKSKYSFLEVLKNLGFIRASNKFMEYPNVDHFYCHDQGSSRFFHLHVYFELTTGESHTKNYVLPLQDELIDCSVMHSSGLKVLSPEWQISIFLLRHFIKISCFPGLILYLRERKGYDKEFKESFDVVEFSCPENEHLEKLNIDKLYDKYLHSSLLTQVYTGIKLRKELLQYLRFSRIYGFYYRYFQIIFRVVNKLFLKKKKKINKGKLIAIVGLDGSGKSTTIFTLNEWLCTHFDVFQIHSGRPPSTLLTYPIRLMLKLRLFFVGPIDNAVDKNVDEYIKVEVKTGYLASLRYLALSFERRTYINKAHKSVKKGNIVLSDRYPSMTHGKMDSPKIDSNSKSQLIKTMAKYELSNYENIVPADLVVRLHVPIEVAVERNKNRVKSDKESDNELRARYQWNTFLAYKTINYVEIDTNTSFDDSITIIKNKVWSSLIEFQNIERLDSEI
jgi:thymidylate kinase